MVRILRVLNPRDRVLLIHMGKLEQQSRHRTRSKDIQKAILSTVAITGMLAVALCAPNALQALQTLGLIPKRRRNYVVIRHAQERLVKHKLLRKENGYLTLTGRGKEKLRLLEAYDYRIKKPKRWDRKWRVIIFDISEKQKTLRDKIRQTLMAIGFIRLQNSVWVYPYDCEDLIALLKVDFNTGKNLLYMVVDAIENDHDLRRNFDLPLDLTLTRN